MYMQLMMQYHIEKLCWVHATSFSDVEGPIHIDAGKLGGLW